LENHLNLAAQGFELALGKWGEVSAVEKDLARSGAVETDEGFT
jgi:hypothetical protein